MPAYSPFLTGMLNPEQSQMQGNSLAQMAAIQPYLTGQPNIASNTPTIPQYAGPISTAALAGSLMGRGAQPQPSAPGTAGTSLLNNPALAGLLQQFFKNQNTPANTPSNNYYYGLAGGQGNPSMYGGSFAGMGAPT